MFRHQLPAYTPLTAAGMLGALRLSRDRPLERLRERLAERYEARRVILTGSGTEALTLAMRSSAPKGRQPLVALPAYACYDLVSSAVGSDARIVFYDVVPETLSPSLTSLSEACARGPDAVVIAPLYGIPVDWDRVSEIVVPTGALLVEDAAQGMGAAWREKPLGSLGDVSVMSFGRGKGWTGGTGGALLVHRGGERVAEPTGAPMRGASVAARATAQWVLGHPRLYWMPARVPRLGLGETRYRTPVEPRAMPEVAAALALAHEQASVQEAASRGHRADVWIDILAPLVARGALLTIGEPEGGTAGYLRFPLLSPRGIQGLPDARTADALGVMPGYPRPLPELPAARHRQVATGGMHGASTLARRLVTLPTHSRLRAVDRRRIASLLQSYAV